MQKQIEQLQQKTQGQPWAQRILSELAYLNSLLKNPAALEPSVRRLENLLESDGAVTRQAALLEEEALAGYSAQAKSLCLICAAHAHIDMNWLWSMPETTSIVIDTFQTMLDMMEEYPLFTFTQSQAATYEIIEKCAPSMLPAIKKRVREGRWEVAATHWVEPDKNMINTESMMRHLLYTKRYLSRLLDLDPDTLQLDFEPDTFGHAIGVPEALAHGGVKYMYHCRGNENEEIYRWRSPSGSEVLVHREPNWYDNPIEYGVASFLPGFCDRNGVKTGLKVYGVGDHGGGPTRRDIERLLEMQSWPLFPEIRFGRIDEYFHRIEGDRQHFPVVEHELNFLLTGCYTSQSRIKQANRFGEDHLYDSEALVSMARLAGCEPQPAADFTRAWKNVLFNHFHDILPGSGVRDTREHALGLFQEADSFAVGNSSRAMYMLGGQIDTSAFGVPARPHPESTAEGAGAGRSAFKGALLEQSGFTTTCNVSDVSRGSGEVRAYTLFNTTCYDREEKIGITLWDWDLPLLSTSIYSASKEEIPFEVIADKQKYWSHTFIRIAFIAKVPAFGYTTCYVARAKALKPTPYRENTRVQHWRSGNPALENDVVRAEFDSCSLALISLTDKRTGEELLSRPVCFRLAQEQDIGYFSAWMLGRYGKIENLNQECFVSLQEIRTGGVSERLSYELSFGSSKLSVNVSLSGEMLRFSVEVDWQEKGAEGKPVPQLQFHMPYAYDAGSVRYDIAGGFIDRAQADQDVPAHLYAAPIRQGGGLMLTTDCKYGYRAFAGALQVSLLRSSHSPDKLPEAGVHHMEIGLAAVPDFDWAALTRRAFCFSHPIFAHSNSLHVGRLPQEGSLLRLTGDARVTALLPLQDGESVLLRLYQNSVKPHSITCAPVAGADLTDALERGTQPLDVTDDTVEITPQPWALQSIRIKPRRPVITGGNPSGGA